MSSRTRGSTRKLSDLARHVVVPDGIVSTGWPAVEHTCRTKMGIRFDDWQQDAGRLALAKRSDGHLAATVGGVGMSIPRQVGKTYWVGGMLFGLCVNTPGLLAIWSAHHASTHGETFLSMQAFAERLKVAPYIDRVYTGSGDEEVRFANGSRILFGAREHGFGRGIPGVDVLVFDEAQKMSERALDAMLPTMNTSKFGLYVCVGTPPRPEDQSEVFMRMRDDALSGESEDSVWIEFGADPGSSPDDRKQWAKANPSYPSRTPVQSMLRLRKRLGDVSWLREGLGIWPDDVHLGPFIAGRWEASADADSQIVSEPMLCVETAMDRSMTYIAAAGRRADGLVHVEMITRRAGTDWVEDWFADPDHPQRMGYQVVMRPKSPSATLLDDLRLMGLPVAEWRGDMSLETGQIIDLVNEGDIRHLPDGAVDVAAATAILRTTASGGSAIDQRRSSPDPAPLIAATGAVGAVLNRKTVSAYADMGEWWKGA